jgi:hypothetical protein
MTRIVLKNKENFVKDAKFELTLVVAKQHFGLISGMSDKETEILSAELLKLAFLKNCGPCHHSVESFSCCGVTPRHSISAGFSNVRMWYQSSTDCISPTRLAANVFNEDDGIFNHDRTIVESDQ